MKLYFEDKKSSSQKKSRKQDTFNIGQKFYMDFADGDYAYVKILDIDSDGYIKYEIVHPDMDTVTRTASTDNFNYFLTDSGFKSDWWVIYN